MKNDLEFVIGLSEKDAIDALKYVGLYRIRVIESNGERFCVTTDYHYDRINLSLKEDKVYIVSRG